MASDVAVDSKDRVWVFAREQHPVSWWTTDGELVGSWGYGLTLGIAPDFFFREPHGIFIDSDDNIWLSEKQRHIVTKHNQSGEILMELGNRDWAAVTNTWDGRHGETVQLAYRHRNRIEWEDIRVGRIRQPTHSPLLCRRRT